MSSATIEPAAKAKIVGPSEGLLVSAPYETARGILLASETNGKFLLAETTVVPGGCPPLHQHEHEDEIWIITEGSFEFIVNGETTIVGPGAVVYSPAGDVHRFRCVSETPGKFYILVTGSNFEQFFMKWQMALANGDMGAAMQSAADHGIKFMEPIGAATTGSSPS